MKVRKRKNDLVQFHARTIGYEFYDGEVVEYTCNYEIREVVKKNDIHAVTKVEFDSSISAAHADLRPTIDYPGHPKRRLPRSRRADVEERCGPASPWNAEICLNILRRELASGDLGPPALNITRLNQDHRVS